MGIVQFAKIVKQWEESRTQRYHDIIIASETDFCNFLLQSRHRKTIEPVKFPAR